MTRTSRISHGVTPFMDNPFVASAEKFFFNVSWSRFFIGPLNDELDKKVEIRERDKKGAVVVIVVVKQVFVRRSGEWVA